MRLGECAAKWDTNAPRDDLACHLVSGVCKVSCETKVGEFELPVGSDEQVVWFQVLESTGGSRQQHSVVHGIPELPYAELLEDRRTRWRMKFLWQNSNPRKVIAIHDLMSAGKKTSVRSLMIISRSLSKNSRTRLRFVFDENTSMSWQWVNKRNTEKRRLTSMMFWWCSSRRYLTSRTADMSRPSLNCPTFIFFIATFFEVDASRPMEDERVHDNTSH